MASGYPYRPLNSHKKEIRVLCFRAQDTTSHALFSSKPLKAYIDHISLLDEEDILPRYLAVSYACGDNSIRSTIIIDGLVVKIPENAETALRYSNHGDRPRTILDRLRSWAGFGELERLIWIDSVCINETDVDERNSQVAMMGQIYSKAYSVLAWLGEDSDGTAKSALESIRAINKQAVEMTNNFKEEKVMAMLHGDTVKQSYGCPPGWSKGTNRDKVSPTGILCNVDARALDSFFSAAWFSRVWVIQEAILAKSVQCLRGHELCDWREVIVAARWISHLRHVRTPNLALNVNIARAHQMFDHWLRSENIRALSDPAQTIRYLEDVLLLAACFDASDERDKIFAVISLMGQYPYSLTPDYRLSVKEVFTRACRTAIVGGKSLNLAIIAQAVERGEIESKYSLPSWVLTFRDTGDPDSNVSIINVNASCAPGCADLFDQHDAGSGDILKLKGLSIDEVKCTPHPQQLFKELKREPHEELRDIWFTAKTNSASYSEENLIDAIYTTLSAGEAVILETPPSANYRADVGFRAFISRAANLRLTRNEKEATETDMEAANLTLWKRSRNRCFFVTSKGRVGTGFPQTRRGDHICILFGAPALVVLRPEGNNWRLVGDAYVHGIMNHHHTGGYSEVPKDSTSKWHAPVSSGYGESGFVAEQVLEVAGQMYQVSSVFYRGGKIEGSVTTGVLGIQYKQEWVPSLIASSKYMCILPNSLAGQDGIEWIPVDLVAKIIIDIVEKIRKDDSDPSCGTKYHHIVNRNRVCLRELDPLIWQQIQQKDDDGS